MRKVFSILAGILFSIGVSAMVTLHITIDDLKVLFNVTSTEHVNDSIYLYGTNKYNIEKIKLSNDTITLFTNNKQISYPYNNPKIKEMIKESVLY